MFTFSLKSQRNKTTSSVSQLIPLPLMVGGEIKNKAGQNVELKMALKEFTN